MKLPILAPLVAALGLAACEREPTVIVVNASPTPLPQARTETLETRTLGKEIDAFEKDASLIQRARVDKAFSELDGEIAELVEHVAKETGDDKREAERKLADLNAYRNGEHVRFLRIQSTLRLEEKRESVVPPGADPAERAEKLGEDIDRAAKKAEDGIKDAADAIRDKAR
jgi:hypothetical protein